LIVTHASAQPTHFEASIKRVCPHQSWNVIKQTNSPDYGNYIYRISDRFLHLESEKTHPFHGHVFSMLIKKSSKLNLIPRESREYMTDLVYSESQLRQLTVIQNCWDSLERLIASIPGHFLILVDADRSRPLQVAAGGVVGLVWLPCWSPSVALHAEYSEFDASFKVLRPYAYSVPMAIIQNETFPLGLSIGQTEREELYDMFLGWFSLQVYGETVPVGADHVLYAKPMLSDEGSALIAIGRRFSHHFHCFGHILEKLGSSSGLALMARKLLYCSTRDSYCELMEETMDDLTLMIASGLPQSRALEVFFSLFGLGLMENRVVWVKPDAFDDQALWNRGPVSTCSNHVEKFHATANAGTSELRNLVHKLAELIQIIMHRFNHAKEFNRAQAKKKKPNLIKKQKEASIDPVAECGHPFCAWGPIYAQRFGVVSFPCIHTVQNQIGIDFRPAPIVGTFIEQHIVDTVPYEGRPWNHEGARPGGSEQTGAKRVFESVKLRDLFLNRDAEMILQLSRDIADFTHHQPYSLDRIVRLSQDYGTRLVLHADQNLRYVRSAFPVEWISRALKKEIQ
jgi:hypothetical protein